MAEPLDPKWVSPDDDDYIARLGGMSITELNTDSSMEYDIIRLHDGLLREHSAAFYRNEIDDLITILQYWRDYQPGRGRNVRS